MKTIVDYAQLVKQQHALNISLAPVETDPTASSQDYTIGQHFILDGELYKAKTAITRDDALVLDVNYEAAGSIEAQIETLDAENQTLANKLNNEIVTRSALGAKNILPFDLAEIKALNTNGTWAGNVYTYRGVDFTVNSDGTISATGTATGGNASIKLFAASSNYEMLGKEVILTGCPSGGGASTYRIQAYRMATADGSTGTYFDDGAGTDAFTALNDASGTVGSFAVAVYENETVTNLLFKPMVRLASDHDDTYQPYAKTNRELTAENETLGNDFYEYEDLMGVKNVLPNNLSSQTVESVDFTVNSDGSITVDGTVTPEEGETAYDIVLPIATGLDFFASDISLKNTGSYTGIDYIFSQGDNGTGGVYLTYVASTGTVNINVEVGTTVNNVTLYPMIRLKDTDNIYKPYTMTNLQITRSLGSQVEKSQITNPNLIDNPWFTVNQRNFSDAASIGGTANQRITVDRWKCYGFNNNVAITWADNILTIDARESTGTSGINEILENAIKSGKTVTVSAYIKLDASAQDSVKRFTISLDYGVTSPVPLNKVINLIDDGQYHLYTATFVLPQDVNRVIIRNTVDNKNKLSIKAVKLEIGSISTLDMDTAPNYATELLKCQRYFYSLKIDTTNAQIGLARAANNTTAQYYLYFAVAMRSSPVLTVANENHMYVYDTSSHVISAITKYSDLKSGNDVIGVALSMTTTGLTQGGLLLFAGGADLSSYPLSLEFSADL